MVRQVRTWAGVVAGLAGVVWASWACAGTPVVLKAETLDDDGMVTLGELFDGAGEASSVPVAAKPGRSVVLNAAAVQSLARRSGLDWANAQGVRLIAVRSGEAASAAPAAVSRANVEVLTYARSLSAGEIVAPEDLVWAKVAAAPADAPSDAERVIGLAAKRPLRAGAAVSARDVSAPQVIKKGEMVLVTYADGQITLTLQAKAVGSAAAGETFNVQNPSSNKVLQALATGPGEALVGPAAVQLRARSFASR
ncbi:flagellar basal body P-ring formation chaperone FlgA [Phenylobacterium sp.]|jgi:flagella basal body P-ring formation protein FlgA|uniref:flagellar basal body P-ring formation chaperone FlgA n=1 Tax=Phenylobacterium sp. TaxID=1871053 RepID=UPI002E34DEA6|nr:flagellar basal body P-ring formation chaperone FlgA [Phenylobacterium sp.]HEX2562061.1 flagellar basal body P-ring formation chaperone FlgA [Phenylobacterium sp.]